MNKVGRKDDRLLGLAGLPIHTSAKVVAPSDHGGSCCNKRERR